MTLGAVVRWMDALSGGVSPPGLIDIVGTRESHLRRRFAMIARYDGKTGRWSATGIVLSLLVGGVALTGAVRGQDAAPAAATPPAAPAAKAAGPAAAAREVKATATAPAQPFDAAAARKLWDEKYAIQIFYVKGVEANREQVDKEFIAEVTRRAGSEDAGKRVLDEMNGKGAGTAPAPEVLDVDVDVALIAQLERKLPEVSFDGAGLSDVIDFLRDVSGANIVVEWGPLTSAGLDRNTPVSLRVKNVKFGRTLDLILSSAGGGQVPLGYTIQENIIRISTREHLDSLTDVRAYDVRDIVPAEVQVGDLTRLIKESVAPDSWGENGGSAGSILATKHKIVVRQTPMNHREVRNLLQRLREDPSRTPQATDAASAAQAAPASPAR